MPAHGGPEYQHLGGRAHAANDGGAPAPRYLPAYDEEEVHEHHEVPGGEHEMAPLNSPPPAVASIVVARGGGAGGGDAISSSPRDTATDGPSMAQLAQEYATEADLHSAFEADAAQHQSRKSPDDHSEDDDSFDLTEDIFHPMQQLRKQQRKWKRDMQCSSSCFLNQVKQFIPALTWIPAYKPRSDLLPDLLAGIMLSVVCVPQGMAYAVLAGLDPIIGLYSCLIPPLMYAFFGTSPVVQVGPFALVALLVGSMVKAVMPTTATDDYYRDATFVFSIMIGLVLILMSVLRLGFAVSFLADCVLSAFTCAAAFLILTSQWKGFLGFTAMPSGMTFLETYTWIFGHIPDINVCELLLGCFSVCLLLGLDHVNAKYKFRVPIPSQLCAVVVGILITYVARLDTAYSIKIVGTIPAGLPSISIPGWGGYTITSDTGTTSTLHLLTFANFQLFLQPVCMIALISYIVSISIAKNFALAENEKRAAAKERAEAAANSPPVLGAAVTVGEILPPIVIDANQELLALGLANFFGGFVSCFPSAGSLSRSALVYNAGVRSSLHNVITVLILILVLLLLTPLLYYLPQTVLAAITFTALKGLLLQITEGKRLYGLRKQDFLMWVCTFVATLIFDTQVGIAVGLMTSLLMLLKQTSRPPVATLGRLHNTDLYRSVKRFPLARTFRNILIFRFDAPLHFANKDYFKSELQRAMAKAQEQEWRMLQPLSPDEPLVAPEKMSLHARLQKLMRLRKLKEHFGAAAAGARGLVTKMERQLRRAARATILKRRASSLGAIRMSEVGSPADPEQSDRDDDITVIAEALDAEEREDRDSRLHHRRALPPDALDSSSSFALSAMPSDSDILPPLPVVTRAECRIEWIVLDCGSLIDIDDAALKMLVALPQQLGTSVLPCALTPAVLDMLSRTHCFETRTPDAVKAAAVAAPSDSSASTAEESPLPPAPRSVKPAIMQPFVTVHQAIKYLLQTQQTQREVADTYAAAVAAAQQAERVDLTAAVRLAVDANNKSVTIDVDVSSEL